MITDYAVNLCGLTKVFSKVSLSRLLFDGTVFDRVTRIKKKKRPSQTDGFYALKDIDLKILKGQCVGIVGANGSGKSTLLQIIAGTMGLTKGECKTSGKIASILELGSLFNPDFTGIENIRLTTQLYGLDNAKLYETIRDIISFADIGDFISKPVRVYSTGMLMRLAFATQVTVKPDILIIDEVLAVGDENFQQKCIEHIKRLKESGTTIVLVTHSSDIIVNLCDEAVMLKSGEVFVKGTPKNVITIYQKDLLDKKANNLTLLSDFANLESNKFNQNKTSNTFKKKIINHNLNPDIESFLDTDIIPQEVVKYSTYNIDICDYTIIDENNKTVNHLVHGEYYTFRYNVQIYGDNRELKFGCMIKSLSGIEICGVNSGYNTMQSKMYKLSFKFLCNLLQGTYSINAGVIEHINGNEEFISRNIDIIVFKVINSEHQSEVGLVTLFDEVTFKTLE